MLVIHLATCHQHFISAYSGCCVYYSSHGCECKDEGSNVRSLLSHSKLIKRHHFGEEKNPKICSNFVFNHFKLHSFTKRMSC